MLLALSRINLAGLTGKPAIIHAIRWLTDMQGRDGSWGHSAAVTALVVQALATHGAPDAAALRRGVVWLLRAQLPDGSWPGPDGRPELTATTTVLTALLVAGVLPGKSAVRNAVRWLLSRQNPDAGWSAAAEGSTAQPSAAFSDPAGTARVVAALVAVAGETAAPVEISSRPSNGARAGWSGRSWPTAAGATVLAAVGRVAGATGAALRPSRYSQRRRGSLMPGLLLPLGALGQFIAARRRRAGRAGWSRPVPAATDRDRPVRRYRRLAVAGPTRPATSQIAFSDPFSKRLHYQ